MIMNKNIFLIIPILLISSCSSTISNSSFSDDTISNSDTNNSSTIIKDKETLDEDNIKSILLSIEDMDKVVSNRTSTSTIRYSSWGDIEVSVVSSKTLYKDNILETISSQIYSETTYNSTSQVYQDDTYLYELTYFSKGDSDNEFNKTLLSKLDESTLSSKFDIRNYVYLYTIANQVLSDKNTSTHLFELSLDGTYDPNKDLYEIDIDYKTQDEVNDNSYYDKQIMNYTLYLEIQDSKIISSDENVITQATYNDEVQFTNEERSTIYYKYDELSTYSGTLLKEEDM